MPELQRLQAALAARGIDLLGLNVDTESDVDVAAYLKRMGTSYRVAVGGAGAAEQLYAGDEVVVPLSFLLDEKGTLLEILPGWSAETQRRLADLSSTGNR
jgi:hypothetical protein